MAVLDLDAVIEHRPCAGSLAHAHARVPSASSTTTAGRAPMAISRPRLSMIVAHARYSTGAVRDQPRARHRSPLACATPPVWKVRMVSCVPGSPIDCAAMTLTASPRLTGVPRQDRARSYPRADALLRASHPRARVCWPTGHGSPPPPRPARLTTRPADLTTTFAGLDVDEILGRSAAEYALAERSRSPRPPARRARATVRRRRRRNRSSTTHAAPATRRPRRRVR